MDQRPFDFNLYFGESLASKPPVHMRAGLEEKTKIVFGVLLRYSTLQVLFWSYWLIRNFHELQTWAITRATGVSTGLLIFTTFNMVFFQALTVYSVLLVLVPRLLRKRRYLLFTGATLLFVITGALCTSLTRLVVLPFVFGKDGSLSLVRLLTQSFDIGAIVFAGLVVSLGRHYYLRDRENRNRERERLQAELDFLKGQLNPHFLFNALNSIYVLMDENKALASESLVKFSSLLRYQLYDCNTNFTSVGKEKEFIADYIMLQKVRHGDNTVVDFIFENEGSEQIAPFILMPFVENAFKHLSHYADKRNEVKIRASCRDGLFSLCVSNSCDGAGQSPEPGSGIGLANVRRRLQLLYPDKHQLKIIRDKNTYIVNLSIQLQTKFEDQMSYN